MGVYGSLPSAQLQSSLGLNPEHAFLPVLPPPFGIPPPTCVSFLQDDSTFLAATALVFSDTHFGQEPKQAYGRKLQDQVSLPTSNLSDFFKRVLPGCFSALCSYCISFALRSAASAVCLSLQQLPRISWGTFTVSLLEPCVGFLTRFCFPKYLCAKGM